jgi:hypothetical protein
MGSAAPEGVRIWIWDLEILDWDLVERARGRGKRGGISGGFGSEGNFRGRWKGFIGGGERSRFGVGDDESAPAWGPHVALGVARGHVSRRGDGKAGREGFRWEEILGKVPEDWWWV